MRYGHAKFMSSHLDGEGSRWMEGFRYVDGTATPPSTPIASGSPPPPSGGTMPRRTWRRPPYGAWGLPYWGYPYPAYDTPILVGVAEEPAEPMKTNQLTVAPNTLIRWGIVALAVIGGVVILKKLTS